MVLSFLFISYEITFRILSVRYFSARYIIDGKGDENGKNTSTDSTVTEWCINGTRILLYIRVKLVYILFSILFCFHIHL